nr:PREDICTED: uncharacterized protein LOC107076578 [Lepisosteus oculatus]
MFFIGGCFCLGAFFLINHDVRSCSALVTGLTPIPSTSTRKDFIGINAVRFGRSAVYPHPACSTRAHTPTALQGLDLSSLNSDPQSPERSEVTGEGRGLENTQTPLKGRQGGSAYQDTAHDGKRSHSGADRRAGVTPGALGGGSGKTAPRQRVRALAAEECGECSVCVESACSPGVGPGCRALVMSPLAVLYRGLPACTTGFPNSSFPQH